MEFFCKNSQRLRADNFFFVKHSILDVWQGSEYAYVMCYSLLGKIVNTKKMDSFAMQIYSF